MSEIGSVTSSSPHHHDRHTEMPPLGDGDTAEWNARYSEADRVWSGNPNGTLVTEIPGLPLGRALDVGCGEGADAVWLAAHGWDVTALDVSDVALERAALHAKQAGVQVRWVHAGLLEASLSPGAFDLVSAQYPVLRRTPTNEAERALLAAVAPGGLFSWSTMPSSTPTTPGSADSTPPTTCSRPRWPHFWTTAGRSRSTRPDRARSRAAQARVTRSTRCCGLDA